MKWIFLVGALLIVLVVLIAAIGALLPRQHSAILSARFAKPPQVVWEAITGPQLARQRAQFRNAPCLRRPSRLERNPMRLVTR
jgi:hypothetical protein